MKKSYAKPELVKRERVAMIVATPSVLPPPPPAP